MNFVKNVKLSVKYSSSKHVTHFLEVAKSRSVKTRKVRNILVLKDKLTLILFVRSNNSYHLNITGIKDLHLVNDAIIWLENTYCNKSEFSLLSYNIDNITSSFDTFRHIPLDNLANVVSNCSYNPERFHALYSKSRDGMVIVFQTGKVNIVGCKSLKNILSLWRFIKTKIHVARSSKTS